MIFRWFENLIDVFDRPDHGTPPDNLLRFYAHYLRRGRWVLASMFVVGFAVADMRDSCSLAWRIC